MTNLNVLIIFTVRVLVLALTIAPFNIARSDSANESPARQPLPVPDYQCPDTPDIGAVPPMARQVQGITAQTAHSVGDLLGGRGRAQFREDHAQGGSEKALKGVRERAMFKSLACGPDDVHYRSGVCQDFLLQCQHHGGGNCEVCARAWAAEYCTDKLTAIAQTPKDEIDEKLKGIDADGEWGRIMAIAEKGENVARLKEQLQNSKTQFIDNPLKENCYALF